jgi:ATP-binding cassette subfamily B protein
VISGDTLLRTPHHEIPVAAKPAQVNPRFEDILRGSAMMRFVPEAHYARLRDSFTEERHEFGEVIVRQGAPADAFYILVSGRARVLKANTGGDELALGRLAPGDEFGESALLEGGTRAASVRASTTVEVLRLDRARFLDLARELPALREAMELLARWRSLHAFLYEFSNFGRLPAPALSALMAELEPLQVRKGERIVREGDSAGPMYVLRAGRVWAYSGARENPVHRAFYREGEYFGELAMLNDAPRAASAEAVSDCELMLLQPASVTRLRTRFPEFDKLLTERIAQYHGAGEARIPLDFAEELLPADVRVSDKTADAVADTDASIKPSKRARIRRFPHVAQIDEMDCGAACFAMVCRHFGRAVSLSRIRELCQTASDGTSLKALCTAGNELGLAARAIKVSPQHLDQMPLPAICHWEGNHWVVVYRVEADRVHIADPARACLTLPRAEFLKKWTGYAALFDYTHEFENAPESAPGLAWLWPFLREHASELRLATGLAALVSVLGLLFPVFTQFVVDKVIVDSDLDLLAVMLPAMVAVLVFLLLASVIQQYLLSFIAVRIDSAVLDFLTRRLLALPMSYFKSRRTGDIQRRLDGARQLRQFLVDRGVDGLLACVQLLGCLALMAVYSLQLTWLFLLVAPLYAGLMVFSKKVLRPLFSDLESAYGRYASHQIDAIKGIEAVKAAGAESSFRDDMLSAFLKVSQQQFRGNFTMMSYQSALQAVGFMATVLFLWAGAQRVVAGEMTVGTFVAFSSIMAMASSAILRALGVWDGLQFMSVLLNRLNDVIEPEPEQGRDRSRLAPVRSLEGHIRLHDVGLRFGGPQSPEILSSISLEIPPGKTYALVGRSGCGKTSLVKLICGLLDPTAGEIYFDRIDSRTLNHRDLRRQIGFVLQENHLFDNTILNNIAFGDPQPDMKRVLWAAQMANAHDFIQRLPLGYESRIGETGLAISGGQRQRIAIARAIYDDPPVLIFDEATSALDTESERAIQKNFAQLTRGRTCLVIAHRLSTIRDADRIVVMDAGRIAEVGTHDELMEKRGLYFYLSSQQIGPGQ